MKTIPQSWNLAAPLILAHKISVIDRVTFSNVVSNQTQHLLTNFTDRHFDAPEEKQHAFQELVSHEEPL